VTPDERERMNWLCTRIQEEKDQTKFNELVSELNGLLETNAHRLGSEQPKPTPS
jgi:hypothetical protein